MKWRKRGEANPADAPPPRVQREREVRASLDDQFDDYRESQRDTQTLRTVSDRFGQLPEGFDQSVWCRPIYREAIEWFAPGLEDSDRQYHPFLLGVLNDAASAVGCDEQLRKRVLAFKSFESIVGIAYSLGESDGLLHQHYERPECVFEFLRSVRDRGFLRAVGEAGEQGPLDFRESEYRGSNASNYLRAFRLPATHWYELLVEYLEMFPESESFLVFALHEYAPNAEALIEVVRRGLSARNLRVRGAAIVELLRRNQPWQSEWADDLWMLVAEGQPPYRDDGYRDGTIYDLHDQALRAIHTVGDAAFDSPSFAALPALLSLFRDSSGRLNWLAIRAVVRMNYATASVFCTLERELAAERQRVETLRQPVEIATVYDMEAENARPDALVSAEAYLTELIDAHLALRAPSATIPHDEGERLLLTIWENPNDDLSKLVLADWYDERDDLRGEFVRLCVGHCALTEETRTYHQRSRLRELGYRLQESLGVRFAVWCRTWEALIQRGGGWIDLSDFYPRPRY